MSANGYLSAFRSARHSASALMAMVLFLFGSSIQPVAAQDGRGGGIVIDGNALGAFIANQLGWQKRQRQQNYQRNNVPSTRSVKSQSKPKRVSEKAQRSNRVSVTGERAKRSRDAGQRSKARKKGNALARGPAQVIPSEMQTKGDGTVDVDTAPESQTVVAPVNIAPSPSLAPAAALEAQPAPALAGNPTPTPTTPAPGTSLQVISTPAEITSAQNHLKYMGYAVPEATGTIDLKTKIAIMQFQDSIGGPVTGVLTMDQMQTLFQKAAAKQSTKTQ